MATWSTVGAGDGPQTADVGADDNNVDFGDLPEDPWAAYGDEVQGGERESSDGWSWTNNEKVDERNKDNDLASQTSLTSSRRRRGKKGLGGAQPRWRSGQVPLPPEFDGDVETDPFCLRHYRRALHRWVRITKEFLPPNEQALRALDAMRGSAALEFEEVDDDRYDVDNGIEVLLGDLEKNFGEKEIYRRGGVIREYETITRVQGESITAFIRRFRLVERKLQDAQVSAYPDESRAIKFLDGLRLDEKTTSHILLAAGNKYNFQAILDAVRMQFPAGLTLTGMARPGTTLSSSTTAPKRGRGGRGKGRGWKLAYKSWNTNEDGGDEDYAGHGDGDGYEAWETAEHYGEEDDYHDALEDEAALENDVIYETNEEEVAEGAEEIHGEDGAQEVLTATSKQMANQKAARGYYDVSNKGKGKKSSKDGKGKGRGSGSSSTTSFNQSKGKDSNNKGKGKPGNNNKGKGYGDGGKSQRQMRFANAQCLGCGSTEHFLRDCPNVTTYQAHLASATAPGSLSEFGEFQSWMVSGSADAEGEEEEEVPVEEDSTLENPGVSETPTLGSPGPGPGDLGLGDTFDDVAAPLVPEFQHVMENEDQWYLDSYDGLDSRESVGASRESVGASRESGGSGASGSRESELLRARSRSRDDETVRASSATSRRSNADSVPELSRPRATRDDVDQPLGADGDILPQGFHDDELFATDFQYTNMLHDIGFRRIIRDFDRAVQPRQGQCTPEYPYGHFTCPISAVGWSFDPTTNMPLSVPTMESLLDFDIFAAITEDDEAARQRQQRAISHLQGDWWKGGWYTWEVNGMSVICCWNHRPENDLPVPSGLTRRQVCKFRSTWLIRRGENHLQWVQHEWNKPTSAIGWTDLEDFRGTFDVNRFRAAVHFFTTKSLGPSAAHVRVQLTHMINFALFSKKKMLQLMIYHDERPRTVNRSALDSPEDEHVGYMVSSESMPLYKQPSITNLLSNADELCCMILDTGCQRQVAGKEWHRVHQGHLDGLPPLEYPERASFRFGPEPAKVSKRRWAYPCGISGHFCVLWISEVDVPAPALCSRHTMSALGAVVDVARGEVFFRGFNSASQLYLTSCGHLSIRIDEFPTTMPSWPLTPPVSSEYPPDCWAPTVQPVCVRVLRRANHGPEIPVTSGDASSTAMASALACAAGASTPVHRQRDHDGKALQCDEYEGQSSRQDLGNFPTSRTGECDVVQLCGWYDEEGDGDGPLRERPIQLRPSKGTSQLRSRRSVGEDLRHVRVSRSGDAKDLPTIREIDCSDTEGNPDIQDSSQHASRRRKGAKATFFKVLFAVLTAAFVQVSTSSSVLFNTQGYNYEPSSNEESSEPTAVASTVSSTTSLGRSLRPDPSRPRGGHGFTGGRKSLQLARGQLRGRALSGEGPPAWEDRGGFVFNAGTPKSLLPNAQEVQELWKTECEVLSTTTNVSRKLHGCKADWIEIYAGAAQITEVAPQMGLQTIEPNDRVYGIHMSKPGKGDVVELGEARKPYLTIYEIECRLWEPLSNLNYHYRPEVLEELRQAKRSAVLSMSRHCERFHGEGRMFSNEDPAHLRLWQEKCIQRLVSLLGVKDVVCDICCFNLRGRQGDLMKEPTRWLSHCAKVLKMLDVRCLGDHEREECMGPNTRLGQVYELTHVVVRGLQKSLESDFEGRQLLVNNMSLYEVPVLFTNEELYETDESYYQNFYVDVNKDVEQWRPLLKEAQERLEGKVSTSAEVKKGTVFFERISQLAPGWTLAYVQIDRVPKCRRLPTRRILEGEAPLTHRAAALLNNDNLIQVESVSLASLSSKDTGAKFDKPCSFAIFIYGEAPATELGERNGRAQPTATLTPRGVPVPLTPGLLSLEEMETVPDRDITFEVDEGTVPKWVQGVLRRLHVNMGHPSNATLVRQWAQVSASLALIGVKTLRCTVYKQMQNIKPSPASRVSAGRSFNELVAMDFIYIHDIAGVIHTILSIVEDASHYHVLQLPDRSTEQVINALVHGWFRFFGPPENVSLDAEGAGESMDFQEMAAQAGCTMSLVPADAHWQLGRAERHGDVAREIANRIMVQHGVQTAEEMKMVVIMTGFAKKQLIRRAGVSPSQWVLGRSLRIPGVLISEGARVEDKLLSDGKKLQQTELMRLDAMKTFLEIDMSNRLRTARLRKSKPFRGGFEIGQRLAYWRVRDTLDGKGPSDGYQQGVLIGVDPGPRGSLWIRNDRGRLVQEQARALEAEEAWMPSNSDFRLLRDAEQELSEKHAVGFDQRQGATEDADRPPLLALPEVQPTLDAEGRPAASISAPPIITQPPQQGQAELQLQQQTSPDSMPPGLSSSQQQPMEDTLADRTKKSAGASSLASAGEVPKRVKTQYPSQPPSRTGSSDMTLVDPASMTAGSAAGEPLSVPPVPEDFSSGSGSLTNRRIDQPGQFDEEAGTTTLGGEQIFQVHAKAYCRLCGSVNKLMEAGVTRCGRCMNSTFTDEVSDVLNWFDEDEKFDSVCKRMTSEQLHVREELPPGRALRDVAAARQWLTSEVTVVKQLDQISEERKYEKDYPIASYAAWYGTEEARLWEMVQNSPSEAGHSEVFPEQEEVDPEHYVVFLQEATPSRDDPMRTRAHMTLYRDRPCEMVWLQRHSRDSIHKTEWDGSPQEMQGIYTNGNLYLQSALLDTYRSGDHQQCYSSWMVHGTAMNSSDDEDDVPRTQCQTMMRELPWGTIPGADVPVFVTAIQSEWNDWCKWSSCGVVAGAKVPKELILPSRVCYRWKPTPNTGGYKAKARIVIQGFRDSHLPLLTDAPVLSRNGMMTILQWSASYGTTLYDADAKYAFLQGLPDDERPAEIYMTPPEDKISLKCIPDWNLDILYKLIAPVYGAANAPRRWGRFRGVVESMKWRVHSLDPCLFLRVATWKDEIGQETSQVVALLGVHVDDITVTALPDWEKDTVDPLRMAFEWGEPWEKDNLVFRGRKITKLSDGGYMLDQQHFVKEVTVTKKAQKEMVPLEGNPTLMSEFRSDIGSLPWLAEITRPDIAADVSLLQKGLDDLNEINKVLMYVKVTADSGNFIKPVDPFDLILIAFGDSGFGNALNNKSQDGLVSVATTLKALQSLTTRSSLDRSEDAANFSRSTLAETLDVRSLFDVEHRTSTTFMQWQWVPSENVEADCLSKRSPQLRDGFRGWTGDPLVSLQLSKDASTESSNDGCHKKQGQQSAEDLTSEKLEFHGMV